MTETTTMAKAAAQTTIDTTMTNPERAWLAVSFPLWIALLLLLGSLLLLRTPIVRQIGRMLAGRAARQRASTGRATMTYDLALHLGADAVAPPLLLTIGVTVAIGGGGALSLVAPGFVPLLLALPLGYTAMRLAVGVAERRAIAALDRSLPAAVGRLGLLLQGGESYGVALERVTATLDDGPLRREWQFLVDGSRAQIAGGLLATPEEVARALSAQTASVRHHQFLEHLAVGLASGIEPTRARVLAAYAKLLESEARMSSARTELAQMRYSGYAIGGASAAMFLYLLLTQQERFWAAYSGPFGIIAAVPVALALAAPFVVGSLLSSVGDLEY